MRAGVMKYAPDKDMCDVGFLGFFLSAIAV